MNTKTIFILIFSLVAIVGISIYAFSHSPEATCYGNSPCKACKTCKSCGHCAKQGSKCGVCK